ncbi:MAG TPA: aldo/keto reductase [Thermoanaerobaculia bacterium]
MSERRRSHVGISRRDVLYGAAASAGATVAGCGAAEPPAAGAAATGPVAAHAAEPPAARGGMRYRRLGRTGLEVSEIGFGSVPLDDPEVLLYAAELGVNYVDTSPCYRGGRCEEAIGRALERARDRFVVTTKWCPHHFGRPARKQVFLDLLDGSLRRLRTDHVDIVLNHEVGRSSDGLGYARLENPEMLAAFETARRAGKVRFLGASGHDGDLMDVMTRAVDSGNFDVLLCRYSFLDYPDQQKLIDRAHAAGVGFVAMKTLAGAKGAELDRFRSRQTTYKQAALKWVLANPKVSNLVISIASRRQVDEYAAAADGEMTLAERAALAEYAAVFGDEVCRFCNRCEPVCPHAVRVADTLRFSMYFHDYGERERGRELYAALDPARRADHCAGCPAPCVAACDYGLPVQRLVLAAHAALGGDGGG